MSQVVSIKVPANFEQACFEFRNKANISDAHGKDCSDCKDFMIFYDTTLHEIRCEGSFPDSVFSALVEVKDRFDGKLFYEGEEWDERDDESVNESSPLEKLWIIFAIVFFPVTLIYLLLRVVVWVPFKIWRATR